MMEQDEEETRVIFKKHYCPEEREWEVVAFFPGLTANIGKIQGYAHMGQHGEMSEAFYYVCKPCTPKEYAPLKKELEKLFGYRLKIVKRITRKDREEAWKWDR